MSPEQTIWLLSMLGALLFIGVGFFGARAAYAREGPQKSMPPPAPPPPPREPSVDRREIERLKQQLEDYRAIHEAAIEETRVLDGQLRSMIEEREQLRSELQAVESDLAESVRVATELERKLEAQQKESAHLRSKLDVLHLEKAETGDLRTKLEEQRTEMELLRQEMADFVAMKSKFEAQREELDAIREEKTALMVALREAERALEDRRSAEELEKRTADLDLEVAALRAKLADLDRLREENARLRAAAADNSVMLKEIKRLEAEQVALKARAFAQPVEPAKELPVAPSSPGAFEKIVTEVAQTARARSVAIADELGFTIAGVGSEHEGLAALCGLLGEIERRAQMLLPVGAVRRITLEMDHGAGVSVCPIAKSDTRISLATLTVGPRPDSVSLLGAVEKAGELLFR